MRKEWSVRLEARWIGKVKLSLSLSKNYVMEAYGEVEVSSQLHASVAFPPQKEPAMAIG
jgi:hypothetical protein